MYFKFAKKLIQVLSDEILSLSSQSTIPIELIFSKKIVKIYKAMSIMES